MFMLFGLEKKALLLVFVLLLARTAHWDIYLSERGNRIHTPPFTLSWTIHSHPTKHLSSAKITQRSWDTASALSSPPSGERVSVWMSCQKPCWHEELAGYHTEQLTSTVTCFLFIVFSFFKIWNTWFFCKDMKSLKQPAEESVFWCFILPLDLPLKFCRPFFKHWTQTIWRFA